MIEDLCRQLKAKRQELGLTIEEAVEKTKLYPSAIRDIEEGKIENISHIYLKGFIRIYASFLGVDIGDSLRQLPAYKPKDTSPFLKKLSLEKEQSRQTASISAQQRDLEYNPSPLPSFQKLIIAVVLIIILFAGLFSFGRFIAKKVSKITKQQKQTVSVTQKAEKQTQPIKKAVKKTTTLTKVPEKSSTPKPSHKASTEEITVPKINLPKDFAKKKEMIVSLTATRNCYIRVHSDGKLLFEGILKKGIVETWKGHKEIDVKISDGSAVYVELNGYRLPSLTNMRKPIKSLKITPAGISVDK